MQTDEQVMSEVMDIDKAASFLNIPKKTVYKMTSARTIPHSKAGKRLLFVKTELLEWVKSLKVPTREDLEAGTRPTA